MGAFLASLVLFLAMAGPSSALYCICKDGVSDKLLQQNIDYACGSGADCSAILQNGACFNPNTVKAHCDYAVNSYYQRKGQTADSCNFQNTATTSQSVPNMISGCVYPSSSSNAGNSTTTNPITSPTGGTGTGTNPITTPTGSTTGAGFGLGPTGNGITNTDGSGSGAVAIRQDSYLLVTVAILSLIWLRF